MYLARDNQAFVMYCVNGTSRSSLLIESTDSMISAEDNYQQHFQCFKANDIIHNQYPSHVFLNLKYNVKFT